MFGIWLTKLASKNDYNNESLDFFFKAENFDLNQMR